MQDMMNLSIRDNDVLYSHRLEENQQILDK